MNKDEILQMRKGRKMRELLAKLVMGWELYIPEAFDDRLRNYWRHPETKEARSVESWHPDENMTDAWMIVSKMRELVWDFYVGFDSDEENWNVMWRETGGTVIEKHIADTAALAICRSALLARGLTQLAPDAGDSVASSGIVHASAESTSQAESAPTQRG